MADCRHYKSQEIFRGKLALGNAIEIQWCEMCGAVRKDFDGQPGNWLTCQWSYERQGQASDLADYAGIVITDADHKILKHAGGGA